MMTFVSKVALAVGLLLLAHAGYSAHEYSALQSSVQASSTSSYAIPLDIRIETVISVLFICYGLVAGAEPLKPIAWSVWAGNLEKRGGAENPFRAFEERPGFLDIRATSSLGHSGAAVEILSRLRSQGAVTSPAPSRRWEEISVSSDSLTPQNPLTEISTPPNKHTEKALYFTTAWGSPYATSPSPSKASNLAPNALPSYSYSERVNWFSDDSVETEKGQKSTARKQDTSRAIDPEEAFRTPTRSTPVLSPSQQNAPTWLIAETAKEPNSPMELEMPSPAGLSPAVLSPGSFLEKTHSRAPTVGAIPREYAQSTSSSKRRSTLSSQTPRRRALWGNKICYILVPLDDNRGKRKLLSKVEAADRVREWEDKGFDTRGFQLANASVFSASKSQTCGVFPDPAEVQHDRNARRFRVGIPDQAEWDAYVNDLKEEKLRALGVTLTDEPPRSVSSPFIGSRPLSRLPVQSASPPITSSNASNIHGAFSPFLGSNSGSPIGSMSSFSGSFPLAGFRGMHQSSQSVAFPAMSPRMTPPPGLYGLRSDSPLLRSDTPNQGQVLRTLSPQGVGSRSSSLRPRRDSDPTLQRTPLDNPRPVLTPHVENRNILHPSPQGHQRNISEALQKDVDAAESQQPSKRRASPYSLSTQAQGEDKDQSQSSHAHTAREPLADLPVNISPISSKQGGNAPSLKHSKEMENKLPVAAAGKSEDLDESRSKGHALKPSLSKFNVEAEEFKFKPRSQFASTFSLKADAFRPSIPSVLASEVALPKSSLAKLNADAPSFQPSSVPKGDFQFSAASLNVNAPVFNPTRGVSDALADKTIELEPHVNDGLSKIFDPVPVDSNLKATRRSKVSKAVPVKKPEPEPEPESLDGEDGRILPPALRQKRARVRAADGDESARFASETPQPEEADVASPTSHNLDSEKDISMPAEDLQKAQEADTTPSWDDPLPSSSKSLDKVETPDLASASTNLEPQTGKERAPLRQPSPSLLLSFDSDASAKRGIVTESDASRPALDHAPETPKPTIESESSNPAPTSVKGNDAAVTDDPAPSKPRRKAVGLEGSMWATAPPSSPPEPRKSLTQAVAPIPESPVVREPPQAGPEMTASTITPPASPGLPQLALQTGPQTHQSPPWDAPQSEVEVSPSSQTGNQISPLSTVPDTPSKQDDETPVWLRQKDIQPESFQPRHISAHPDDGHFSSAAMPPTVKLGVATAMPSYDEIDAVMRQLQDDPDLGVERIHTPAQPKAGQLRSEALSPGPEDDKIHRRAPLSVTTDQVRADVSDWNEALSAADESKFEARSGFFDTHVNEIVGGILEDRLEPLQRTMVDMQRSIALLAESQQRLSRTATSDDTAHSDADDEDGDSGFGRDTPRGSRPAQGRKIGSIKSAVAEALAAHLDESERRSHAALRSLASEVEHLKQAPRHDEMKFIVEEALSAHHPEAPASRAEIEALESKLRIANEKAEHESFSRKRAESALSAADRQLVLVGEEAAQYREAAEEAERVLRLMQADKDADRSLEQEISDLTLKNTALERTLDEYRLSHEQWRSDMDEERRANTDLRHVLSSLRREIEDSTYSKNSLRVKVERLQNDMTSAVESIAADQASWINKEHRLVAATKTVEVDLHREKAEAEKSRSELDSLQTELKDFLRFKEAHSSARSEISSLEALVVNLRQENRELEDARYESQRQLEHVSKERQETTSEDQSQLTNDFVLLQSQQESICSGLQEQVTLLESQLEQVKDHAEETAALRENYHEELVSRHEQDLHEARESKEAAVADQRRSHEKSLNDLRERHARALHNSSDDKHRLEASFNEKQALSDDKVRHLESKVADLTERLEITVSAARAAAKAASDKGVETEFRIPSPPRTSASISLAHGSNVPEKISPQALRESIMVLQDQLQQREQTIESLESEIAAVDKNAPVKIRDRDTEIAWLRELLGVRLDDLEDIIRALSETDYDRETVKNAVIRLKANLQMEQQERERAALGMSSILPSVSALSSLAQSPRALPMAAAAAWGQWRKTSSLGPNQTHPNQTPSRSVSGASTQSFLSGLLTPPNTQRQPSPTGGASTAMSLNGRKSSEARPLRGSGQQPRSISARQAEKRPLRQPTSSKPVQASRAQQPPKTPPMRRGSYDRDADARRSILSDLDDDASLVGSALDVDSSVGEPFETAASS